ncbi:MAG TPA: metallophosphoesterase [Thermomicrobiales bacterium]|mgnify:CR=1 FL=1
MSRRAFALGGALGALAALGLSSAEAYAARYVNPYSPRLERVRFRLPEGKEGLAGLRIGFITDTHVGPFITPDDLARATELLAGEQPDLLLLGGDYVSEIPRLVPDTVDVLAELASKTPLGAFAVLGNHDLALTPGRLDAAMEASGIAVLRNRAVAVEHRGETLWIAGIDETILGNPDPQETFASIPPGAAALALWHEPQFAEEAAALGAFAQLSGHTHGGQVRLPGIGPVGLPPHGRRHVIGLGDADGMPIYTSRGVGVYRPPVRFNCPPEVTLVELVAA